MKKGLTEIVCVVDRSGSMSVMKEEAIAGFNKFLKEQKECPGDANLTYTQFDDEYEIVHEGKPIAEIPELDGTSFVPRSMTALLDAVGRTIDAVGARLQKTPEAERPERVLFVILTDGAENASKEYKLEDIKKKIALQRDTYSWEFVFLAQGPDAFQGAVSMGVSRSRIAMYAKGDAEGHTHTLEAFSKNTKDYRAGGTPDWATQK